MSDEAQFAVGFTARVLPVEGPIEKGDCLIFDPDYEAPDGTFGVWRIATAVNRAAIGGTTEAIALTDYGLSIVGTVSYQAAGVVSKNVSGLPAGAVQLVRVSSAGRLERIASYSSGDDIVGYAQPNGRVKLHIGLPWQLIAALASGLPVPGTAGNVLTSTGVAWTSAAPTGVTAAGAAGDIQVRAPTGTGLNVVGYWKAQDNAGKLRATYWDTDGTTLRANLEVSGGASFAGEQYPSTGLFRFSGALLGITDWPIATVWSTALEAARTFISFTGGGPLFGDRNGDLPTQIYGNTVDLVALASITLSAGGNVGVTTPFYCSSYASLTRLSGLNSGGASTSGLGLDSSTIATSGGSHTLTSTEAATVCLAITGTGGTLVAPNRPTNIYLLDASGCSGSVTFTDSAGGVTIAAGEVVLVYHDGTDYRRLGIGSGSTVTLVQSKTTQAAVSTTDITDVVARVQTTSATATDVYTFTLPTNAVTTIDIRVTACQNNTASADAWVGTATFKNAAGTVATVDPADITHRGSTAWSVTITNSTTTCKVTVTGAAATTIEWAAAVSYQTTRQS